MISGYQGDDEVNVNSGESTVSAQGSSLGTRNLYQSRQRSEAEQAESDRVVNELRQVVADGYYPQGDGRAARAPSPDYSMEGSSPEDEVRLCIYGFLF